MTGNESFENRGADRSAGPRRRTWGAVPWIMGALLLVILAVMFLPQRADRRGVEVAMPEVGGTLATGADRLVADVDVAVGEFVDFVTTRRASDAMGLQHEYTAEGLRRLAAAISALATRDTVAGFELEPRIQMLRERADALQRDPNADTHARQAREAFLVAASVLEDIQDRRFPHLDGEATAVVRAAEGVEAGRPLTEQESAVGTFFERASHLLRGMSGVSR